MVWTDLEFVEVDNSNTKAVKAGIGYTLGNIMVKGIAFITIPLYSALMLPEQYGIYNTFAAYVSMFAVIVSLGLPSSVRNARFDFTEDEHRYHANSATMIVVAAIVAFVIAAAFPESLSNALGMTYPFVIFVVIDGACMALHSYCNNLLMIDFRSHLFLRLSFFYSVTSILLSTLLILTFFCEKTALARAIGNTVPLAIIAVWTLWRIWRKHPPQITEKYSVYGLRFGIPLIPNDLSSLILTQFDRIMILRTVGEAQAGIYSFSYNVAVIYQVITGSLENAWTPWMFRMLHDDKRDVVEKKISEYVVGITIFTGMFLLICPEFITLMSDRDYWDSRKVVVPIIFSMYFFALASIPIGIEFYHKKTMWISACTFAAAIGNVILNSVFLPKYGYTAAAYTTLVCYALYAIIHIFAAGRLEDIRLLALKRVWKSVAAAAAAFLVSALALDHWRARWRLAGMITVCLLTYGIVRREKVIAAVNLLRNSRGVQEDNFEEE